MANGRLRLLPQSAEELCRFLSFTGQKLRKTCDHLRNFDKVGCVCHCLSFQCCLSLVVADQISRLHSRSLLRRQELINLSQKYLDDFAWPYLYYHGICGGDDGDGCV